MTHNTREVEETEKILWCVERMLDGTYKTVEHKKLDILNYLKRTLHHQLQKARQDWLQEEIVRLEGEKLPKTNEHGSRSFFVGAGAQMRMETHNQALQTIIDRYQAELNQDNK